jgi:predicted permease
MNWLGRVVRRTRMEEQLEKELRFHLDQHAGDLIARGYDPDEARRLARLSIGGPEQVKEQCRDARGTRWVEDFWHDVRYTARTLRQNAGFTAVALLTLALGAGATTVMFTVVNGVLLKPLPYPQPGRMVLVEEETSWSNQFGNRWGFTFPNYLDCQRQVQSLEMAAGRPRGGTLSMRGRAERIDAFQISASMFSVIGVPMLTGRAFSTEDDQPGAAPVAVISSSLWKRLYGGDSSVIGAPLVFDGASYTIIGVARPEFRLWDDADVFFPIGQDRAQRFRNREVHVARVWGRLRPGATLAQAGAELSIIGRQLEAEYPKSNRGRTFVAEPLRPEIGDIGPTLWLLLGAVGLVLLIACANIGSLLLARAVSRERELAMRSALGASRMRLARQCLTESAVLATLGGLLGVGLAAVGIRPFVTFWPGSLPRADEVGLDWRVLGFALAVSLISGLLFGLAPALRVSSKRLEQSLRSGGRALAGNSRRLHGAFVVAEIALAVVLLTSAGMLGRTLVRLSSVGPGVNVRNVMTARMGLSPATLENSARTRAAWDDILDRARRVPGVQAVAMVDTVPMRQGTNQIPYWTTPVAPPEDKQLFVLANSTSPDYLKVMGMTLRCGRYFNDQDRLGTQHVAVVDEVMAQQAFGGEEQAIGKHVWTTLESDPLTVVGVVNHVRHWGPAGDDEARVRAQLYYPFAQVPDLLVRRWSELMSIAVRTSVDPLSVVEPLRREVRGAASDQVMYQVRTMEQLASAALERQRFLLLLFGVFAGLALLLACIGIYGVLAYLTGRRTPEIGVRVALGASRGDVVWMVLRQSLGMTVSGAALGLVAAIGAGRVLQHLVEGMRPGGLLTFVSVAAVLLAAALGASFVPARRASRVDPMRALRQE